MKNTILLLCLLLPMLSFAQDLPSPHYKIYSTGKQKLITPDELIGSLDKTDVLFFGEEHNDSTGHLLEYTLLSGLAARFPGKTALSMEMFETDCQTVVDEYLNGLIREKNFVTEARAWPNYKDYRPMLELAKTNGIPVIAANAPARYTNMVNRLGLESLGKLSPTGRSYLPPLPVDTAAGAYYEKFAQIMGGHAGMPGMQMYQAQSLWDATMGWSIAKFFKGHPGYKILQLNGGFHSEERLGAVAQLEKYAPGIRVTTIAAYSDDSFDKPDWDKLAKNADYIILTDPKLPKNILTNMQGR